MPKHTSLEITINVSITHAADGAPDIETVEWQFDVQPRERFRELSPLVRAALWSKLRDEIDEYWFSAALEDNWEASWNHWLEDVSLE